MFIHRYTLHRRDGGMRIGALLRVNGGFADVHPWPELGDAPLEDQLALLARGETTPLTRASLRLARLDAEARRSGVSLFEGLIIPLSHWPGNDPPPEFDTIKTKGVVDFPENVRIRIDFNARISAEEFARIAETLPKERIDFIEDPCPYDEETWRALRKTTGVKLAYDQPPTANRQPPTQFDVLIHKPAKLTDWRRHNDVVVTSYMDHPVGQFGAAYIAATHDTNARCGLFTHVLYEPDAFLERVESDGARLRPPRGTGIGFDDLLENLPWTSIG
ncbi:MAG TPA: enolase C-terminal domain-like protein [Thermoanaerobaculia bacterium]|nr:enolase C-terminal domain-like protein [Thermoanaerobaculia bacterium]